MIAKAKVLNGNLIYDRIADFYQQLANFEGHEVEIEIKKKKKTRSNNQNRYYFGVVIESVRKGLFDIGYSFFSNEQVHEFLKLTFLKKNIVNEETGEVITTLGSTAEMSTEEFMNYITEIKVWAAEYLSITIPEPNE